MEHIATTSSDVQVPLNWSDQFQSPHVRVLWPRTTTVQQIADDNSCESHPVVFNNTIHVEDPTRCYVNEVLRRDNERCHDDGFSGRLLSATESVYLDIKSREADADSSLNHYASLQLWRSASFETPTSSDEPTVEKCAQASNERSTEDCGNSASGPTSERSISSDTARELLSTQHHLMKRSECGIKQQQSRRTTSSSLPPLTGHPGRMWTVERSSEALGIAGHHITRQSTCDRCDTAGRVEDTDEFVQRHLSKTIYERLRTNADRRTVGVARDTRRPISLLPADHVTQVRAKSTLKPVRRQHPINAVVSRGDVFITVSKPCRPIAEEHKPPYLTNSRTGTAEKLSSSFRLVRSSLRRQNATLQHSRKSDDFNEPFGDVGLVGCQHAIGPRISNSGNVSRTASRDSGISFESTKMAASSATSRRNSAMETTQLLNDARRTGTDAAAVHEAVHKYVIKRRQQYIVGYHRIHSAAPPPSPA